VNGATSRFLFPGSNGAVECLVDRPAQEAVLGLALVCHPHPLFGGTNENKVVTTLARAFTALGWIALRPNFRGVGASAGTHDGGEGETADMRELLAAASTLDELAPLPAGAPLLLSGFSFGSLVAARLARERSGEGRPPRGLVLVGAAAGKWPMPPVEPGTLLIHGEQDETIPLADVMDWARDSGAPVVVIPGADHFFHRRLTLVKSLVVRHLAGAAAAGQVTP